ncbi:hypothetical protein C8T65DRAFT_743599 [Cerioporus squamosus]|nr:hypothetical protein C8T65DRAFT_743599 [Cerioporus squamosus]
MPTLRRLAWAQDEQSRSGTTFSSLSSTSLVELHLHDEYTIWMHDQHKTATTELVTLLPSQFPALQKLVFVLSRRNAWYNVAIVTSLTSMKRLRSLRFDSTYRVLDYTLLRQLFASLPLEHLYFWIADFDDSARSWSIPAHICDPWSAKATWRIWWRFSLICMRLPSLL